MKNRFLILILILAGVVNATPAFSQNLEKKMTTTVETAFGSIAATYAAKLTDRAYTHINVVNDTDCDVQIRLDDVTGAPDSVIPAGTSETIEFGGFVGTSVSLQYMSGETCSSGSVYIKGIY